MREISAFEETIIIASDPGIQSLRQPKIGDLWAEVGDDRLRILMEPQAEDHMIWMPLQFDYDEGRYQWEIAAGHYLGTDDPDVIRESYENFLLHDDPDDPGMTVQEDGPEALLRMRWLQKVIREKAGR